MHSALKRMNLDPLESNDIPSSWSMLPSKRTAGLGLYIASEHCFAEAY